jgi:hypothetical protein
MNQINGALAPTGPACLEKASTLFFVSHPKYAKLILGPFLTEVDAECGRKVMRSSEATVTSSQAEVDYLTRWRAENNGAVVRAFAEGASHG